MNEPNKPKINPSLAEIQAEAAEYGVKVVDGSARSIRGERQWKRA